MATLKSSGYEIFLTFREFGRSVEYGNSFLRASSSVVSVTYILSRTYCKYSNTFKLLAKAVSITLKAVHVPSATLTVSQNNQFLLFSYFIIIFNYIIE